MSLKISIITVCYNSVSTIEDTLKSVVNQKYQNIEYIIIDGGSTDGTQKIVKSYISSVDQFISEKDNGIYDAMNKGINLATGDVIGIINSDDVYHDRNTIGKVALEFNLNQCDSVFGDLLYVKSNNLNEVVRFWKSSQFTKGSFKKGWHPPHPTFFVKRDIYKKHGGFDLSMEVSADFELMLRLLERFNISSVYIPEVLVKMRIGGESNRSVKNIIIGNKNILRAFHKNHIKISKVLYPIFRLVPKFKQFVFKK